MMLNLSFPQLLISLIVIVIGLTVHEFAHAVTAHWFGDRSQSANGRLSFNPIKHLDLWGFIVLLIAGFGWAKPVMIDHRQIKSQHLAPVLIALAGPFSNLLLALLGFLLVKASQVFGLDAELVQQFLFTFIAINLGLFLFNMLPIPPLDGSHLVTEAFFKGRDDLILKFYQIGSIALLALVIIDTQTTWDLIPIRKGINLMMDWGIRLFGIT